MTKLNCVMFLVICLCASVVPSDGFRVKRQQQYNLQKSGESSPSRAESVRTSVQTVLNEMATKHNISISFGFVDRSGSVGLTSGVDDVWTGTALDPKTMIPAGSVGKPFTAIQVMQAVESGRIKLSDKAHAWVDPALSRLGNTTLAGIYGAAANKITIRDLISMRSGINDYEYQANIQAHLTMPDTDLDPFWFLRSSAKQGWACAPGECSFYSGANYVLLGFVLLELQAGKAWEDLDQMAVIPDELRSTYQHLAFAKRGKCSQYAGIAHQMFSMRKYFFWGPMQFYDILYNSCLNGWTMGNVMSSGEDLARFWNDVAEHRILGKETLNAMMNFEPLQNSWCPGCQYGLGLFKNVDLMDKWTFRDPQDSSSRQENLEKVKLQGHGGENYGSAGRACGFNAHYGFGTCTLFTSTQGRQCNSHATNGQAISETTCKAYDAVMAAIGGPRMDCGSVPEAKPDAPSACEWQRR